MVHNAFPNIKCIVERRSAKATSSSNAERGIDDTGKCDIDVSISVRNHLADNASTSRTMRKALAAVLRCSEEHSQTTLEEYVDDITYLPTFTIRSAPDVSSITRKVFMERSRTMAAQTPSLSSMPAGQVLGTMSRMYDAHESGQWGHLFPGAKQQFYFILKLLAVGTQAFVFNLDTQGIGNIPISLLFDKLLPNAQYDLFDVAYRLFLQMAVVFSTPTNLECCGPMTLALSFPSPERMEAWINFVS
jgi:hypothetical protein